MNLEAVPESLRSLKQWVCWRYERRGDDKPTKVPVTIGGYGASSTDPADWYSFEDVCAVAGQFDGIGFVFSASDDYLGIDLDNCLGPGGEIADWAVEILKRFDGTYAEISPSGTGVKIWCHGQKPPHSRSQAKTDGGQIEFYSSGRFFTVTANVWDDSPVTDQQAAVDWLVEKYLQPSAASPTSCAASAPASYSLWQRGMSYVAKAEPAAEGGRNNKAFRLAGHLAAIVGDHGEKLSEDQITSLVKQWNIGNSPPLEHDELVGVVGSAIRNGSARPAKEPERRWAEPHDGVDLSGILGPPAVPVKDDDAGEDDEDFFRSMVPEEGLLKEIFDYYWSTSFKRTYAIGLAVAVSICETIFGRRIQSHTGLRTNDYNIVLAGTSTGKESCESAALMIISAGIQAAGSSMNLQFVIPPDVQSGNALLREVAELRCGLWICDEFGKHLEVILDKKSGNTHAKQIGTHLLKMYGKSNAAYHGASHSGGRRHSVEQPHLCLLGMTTGSVFDVISASQIEDGLFGRLSFWPVQQRPRRARNNRPRPVPDSLAKAIARWMVFQPGGVGGEFPDPVTIEMTEEARLRWENHADEIDVRMDDEAEIRAAVWGRVAARSMKLALVHCACRFGGDPAGLSEEPIQIELQDVEWGIRLANWLASLACSLVREKVQDVVGIQARSKILESLSKHGELTQRWFTREYRTFTAGDFRSAARELEASGAIAIEKKGTNGRPSLIYRLLENQGNST